MNGTVDEILKSDQLRVGKFCVPILQQIYDCLVATTIGAEVAKIEHDTLVEAVRRIELPKTQLIEHCMFVLTSTQLRKDCATSSSDIECSASAIEETTEKANELFLFLCTEKILSISFSQGEISFSSDGQHIRRPDPNDVTYEYTMASGKLLVIRECGNVILVKIWAAGQNTFNYNLAWRASEDRLIIGVLRIITSNSPMILHSEQTQLYRS